MSDCKVCSTSRGVTQESLLDGRHIHLCNVCRRYLQGLLRSCETVKNVRGVTASRKTNLFATNGRRNEL